MRITSMEITNKEFKKSMRGYNQDEVDEFLDKISEDYETVYKENSNLREKIVLLEDKINHYDKLEKTIQNTLVMAQDAAEQARESAKKESELILKNANNAAQKILDKAHSDVIQINDEFERTKQDFSKFRTKFRSFMETQLQMFDDMEKDFVKNYNIGFEVVDKMPSITEGILKEKEIEEEKEMSSSDKLENDIIENSNGFTSEDELEEIKNFFVKG